MLFDGTETVVGGLIAWRPGNSSDVRPPGFDPSVGFAAIDVSR